MIEKELNKLEEILIERKEHIEKSLIEIGHRKGGEFDIPFPEYGSTSDENAMEVADWERLKATESALETELSQIVKTLESIQKGDYGLCQNCQKPIEPPRLSALPTALTCINCAKAVAS